jgi:hypothetical protein
MATVGDKINITTDDITNAISILDSSLNIIESSLSSSISSDFVVLSDLDLFSDGLSKLKAQIDSLKQSNENLMTKISTHAVEIMKLEENIVSTIQNELVRSSAGSGGGGSYYSDIDEVGVSEVGDNNNIANVSNAQLFDNIGKLSISDIDSLLSFLNINKGEYSINDILLSDVGSGILLCLLKKFYGDNNVTIDTKVSEESFNIQKLLLEKLLVLDTGINGVSFKDNSILVAKDYFTSIAKENNIAVSELLLNEKHEKLLLDSINKLYLGKDIEKYNVDEKTINSIKKFVDNVAEENGVTVDKVLSNTDYLGDLKGV